VTGCFGFLPRFALGFSSWKAGGGSTSITTEDSSFVEPSLLLLVPLAVFRSNFGVLLDATDASIAA
jgi:hypothetical protein